MYAPMTLWKSTKKIMLYTIGAASGFVHKRQHTTKRQTEETVDTTDAKEVDRTIEQQHQQQQQQQQQQEQLKGSSSEGGEESKVQGLNLEGDESKIKGLNLHLAVSLNEENTSEAENTNISEEESPRLLDVLETKPIKATRLHEDNLASTPPRKHHENNYITLLDTQQQLQQPPPQQQQPPPQQQQYPTEPPPNPYKPRRRRIIERIRQQTRRRQNRRRLFEDHYRVEAIPSPNNMNSRLLRRGRALVLLPGAPRHDENMARDFHDFFNLVVLVPIVALNVLNWNWDIIAQGAGQVLSRYAAAAAAALMMNDGVSKRGGRHAAKALTFMNVLESAWTGDWFESFFAFTAFYFIIDLIWVVAVPQAVRSPSTIIQHHVATLLYILLPYFYEECRWCMGACMIVEINTWFLIARRVFNKQGFPPWKIVDLSFFSLRVKFISIFFYITWIGIRVILYPCLMLPFYNVWVNQTKKSGTGLNLVILCLPLHAIFCLLNLKWTYELFISKIRYWRRKAKGLHKNGDHSISRGL